MIFQTEKQLKDLGDKLPADKKAPIETALNKLTSDYDPKNALDIEKYLSHKEKIHPDDQFVLVDVDSLPPA
jgi:molecular chaperone DnaK (HSP70)